MTIEFGLGIGAFILILLYNTNRHRFLSYGYLDLFTMKKAIASSLCSAFVIPGLGQILNKELKKGILLLGGVFLLFIIGVIKMVQLVKAILQPGHLETLSPDDIMLRLKAQDSSLLWVIMALIYGPLAVLRNRCLSERKKN